MAAAALLHSTQRLASLITLLFFYALFPGAPARAAEVENTTEVTNIAVVTNTTTTTTTTTAWRLSATFGTCTNSSFDFPWTGTEGNLMVAGTAGLRMHKDACPSVSAYVSAERDIPVRTANVTFLFGIVAAEEIPGSAFIVTVREANNPKSSEFYSWCFNPLTVLNSTVASSTLPECDSSQEVEVGAWHDGLFSLADYDYKYSVAPTMYTLSLTIYADGGAATILVNDMAFDFEATTVTSTTTTTNTTTTSSTTNSTTTTTTLSSSTTTTSTTTSSTEMMPYCTPQVLYALAENDYHEIIRFRVLGIPLDCRHHDGEFALHRALRFRQAEISLALVRTLPSYSPQIHEFSRQGSTALLMAAGNHYQEAVQILLQKRADASLADASGRTALHLGATREGIVNLLLHKSGIDNKTLLEKYDDAGDQPLHLALRGLAPDAALLMVNTASESVGRAFTSELVQAVDGQGDYPVHLSNRGDVFRLLKSFGASLQVRDREGALPLHTASRWPGMALDGSLPLLARNVSLDARDQKMRTPLHYAALQGNTGNVKWLIDNRADINMKDSNGEIPLVYALRNRHVNLVGPLAAGGSPLHAVVSLGYLDVLKDMVINQSYPVEALDQDNRSALFMAAKTGRVDIVEYLVNKGADVNRMDAHGLTVLSMGLRAGRVNASVYLLGRGAIVMKRIQNSSTHLHVAAQSGNMALAEELLRRGAVVNATDFRGFTALHVSSSAGVVEVLMRARAGVLRTFQRQLVPIHTAVLNGHQEVLKELMVWRTSEVDVKSSKGTTPLHMAVISKQIGLVSDLFHWCATVTVRDNKGKGPIEYAHDARILAMLRDADLVKGRCQCDCGLYAPGPMYATSNWHGSCHADVRCRLGGSRAVEQVRCEPRAMPPLTSSLDPNLTGAWQPERPSLRCSITVASGLGQDGRIADVERAVVMSILIGCLSIFGF